MVVCQVGLWVMSVKGQVGGERGREKESGKKRFLKEHLLLPLLHVQGKEKKNNVVQNDTVLCYFFFFEKKNEFENNQKLGYGNYYFIIFY
jgi:hypothetical protein